MKLIRIGPGGLRRVRPGSRRTRTGRQMSHWPILKYHIPGMEMRGVMEFNSESRDTRIYIVDDHYRIVYFNHALGEVFPSLKTGELCYRALCGESAPCSDCPLGQEDGSDSIFYNQLVDQWVEVNTGRIDWPGEGRCHAVFARKIQEGNRNLFFNLTSTSAYDVLFEMNLTRDMFKVLYQVEGKYNLPSFIGRLAEGVEIAARILVHPDDREVFRKFWSLESLLSRLASESKDNMLRGQFRSKRADGSYCWVVQTVVPVRHGGNGDKIVMCFIQDIDEQKQRELELRRNFHLQDTNVDPLTGVYRRAIFFREAEAFLKQAGPEPYCLMAVDIEHFKLFNEWYGQEAGDSFLVNFGTFLREEQQASGGIAGYMGGDDFGIILPDRLEVLERLQNKMIRYAKERGGNAGFQPAFGIFPIADRGISVSTMYDRAVIALGEMKGNYARRSCRYDSRMKRKMEENHMLLSEVQRALEQDEFTFYAQPKCNMATGKIIGLESLVRWNHPERGLIAPGDFLPLLEENGFISNLDRYIWDKVCFRLKNWIQNGHRPVPISVNVSRVDVYALDVVKELNELTDRYGLDPRLLEVEITESAYAEDTTAVAAVVEGLRTAGFTVLMDDFGSGYSSLNMLKDVNVDVLKIDMKFLDMDEQSVGKGVGILEAITNMARLMGLRLIAEGVETREQVDFLLNLGCIYGQGYYFYRPMPVADLEARLSDERNVDFRGLTAPGVERLSLDELLRGGVASDILINNILGGVAFYDVCGDQIELTRANVQYYKVTRTNPVDLEEYRRTILEGIYEEDRPAAVDIFRRARLDPLNGAEGDIRRLCEGEGTIWMHLRAFFLREQGGHQIFYGAVSDVTEQRRREQKLEASQRALASAVRTAEDDEGFKAMTEDNRRAAAAIFAQMAPGGLIGGYCEEGFPLYFANQEMVGLLGYQSFAEFSEAIRGRVINTIHPDDRLRVMEDIGDTNKPGTEYMTTYRMMKKNGGWFWALDKGKVVLTGDGCPAIISACADISEPMAAQKALAEHNRVIIRQNQELHFLNNETPGGYHCCENDRGLTFMYISNRFLGILGYNAEEIKARFDNKMMNMIHPDDRERVRAAACQMEKNGGTTDLEYRIKGADGYIWAADQSRYIREGSRGYVHGVVLDITALKQKEYELWVSGKRTESILKQAGLNCWDWDFEKNTLVLTNVVQNVEMIGTYQCFRSGVVTVTDFPERVFADFCLQESGRERYRRFVEEVRSGENCESHTCEVPVRVRGGKTVWVRVGCETIRDEEGRPVRAVGYYTDVTKQKNEALCREEQLKTLELLRSQATYDFQVNLTRDMILSGEGREKWMREADVPDGSYTESVAYLNNNLVTPEFQAAAAKFMDRDRLLGLYRAGIYTDSLEYRRIYKNQVRWMKAVMYLMQIGDRPDVYSCIFVMDIDEQKSQELKLRKLAATDSLTGLYNRQSGVARIREYLCSMEEDETAALIMLDLDDFKVANDVFGHACGDRIIAENAAKLKRLFREKDVVCRIGGDEFLVLCKQIRQEDADRKMDFIVRSMKSICSHGDREILFSVSVGYAMTPDQGRDFDELYRKADIALFAAKMDGKGRYKLYEPSMKAVRYELADRD